MLAERRQSIVMRMSPIAEIRSFRFDRLHVNAGRLKNQAGRTHRIQLIPEVRVMSANDPEVHEFRHLNCDGFEDWNDWDGLRGRSDVQLRDWDTRLGQGRDNLDGKAPRLQKY